MSHTIIELEAKLLDHSTTGDRRQATLLHTEQANLHLVTGSKYGLLQSP